MFGSIHTGTPDMYPLHPTIMDAFRRSDYLAVEVWDANVRGFSNFFLSYPTVFAELLAYTDGRTLADDLTPELHGRLMEALAEREYNISRFLNISLDEVDNFMPVLWSWVLWQIPTHIPHANVRFASDLGPRCPYGLDNFFVSQARYFRLPRMPILSIECPVKVATEFAGMSMEGQIQGLKSWLGEFDDLFDESFADYAEVDRRAIYALWKSGNDEAL